MINTKEDFLKKFCSLLSSLNSDLKVALLTRLTNRGLLKILVEIIVSSTKTQSQEKLKIDEDGSKEVNSLFIITKIL